MPLQSADSFAARLSEVIELMGSRRALARAAGVAESTLQMCQQRGSAPTLPLLLAVSRGAHVNLHWLATGEGEARVQAQLDRDLLKDVIAAVEQGVRELKAPQYSTPAKKAQLIVELYNQFSETSADASEATAPRPPRLLRLVQRRLVA